jgi:chromosome segregation ATPase
MLVGFIFVYMGHVEKAHAKEKAVKAQIAKEKADLEAKKKAAEAKAREDATKRQEERDAEEKKKADEKAARQAADDKKVRDETAKYTAKVEASQKQIDSLEAELARIRKEKDATSRDAFETAKKVELARVARRNAELEIQRMTEMISRRASDSSLTKPPVVPPPPPAKK